MNYLRLALEDNTTTDQDVEYNTNNDVDYDDNNDIEYNVTETNADIELFYDESEANFVSMESLVLYSSELNNLVENNIVTQATINLINFATNRELKRVNSNINIVSLESNGVSILQQHTLAMEGIRDILFNMFQVWVVRRKHWINATSDFFRSLNGKVVKYSNKLHETEGEYSGKKSSFTNSTHNGSLDQLWYFFATDAGQTTNVIAALSKDTGISKYILVTYPNMILDATAKLINVIKNTKLKNISDVENLVKQVEKLNHPVTIFNNAYIGGKQLLGVNGLVRTTGAVRNAITIKNTTFNKLATLATADAITETFSKKHTTKKVLSNISFGTMVDFVLSAKIQYNTNDIGKVIDYGYLYIDNIKTHLSLNGKLSNLNDNLSTALLKMFESIGSGFSTNDAVAIQGICTQIDQYGTNLLRSFQVPAVQEINRSLKGSKYCMYLANRMIYNAT